jgi:diacylglycerol kinase family enzyme
MADSRHGTRYGIIVNPSAGEAGTDTKRRVIRQCADILGVDTVVEGWDTTSPEELRDCTLEIARRVDVLVVAGGDGTLSDIINTTGSETVLAYLPMGSGNAWRNTLGLPRSRTKTAEQIRGGRVRSIDLVLVDERRKGLLASVGFEGRALRERRKLLAQGVSGFDSYFRATAKLVFGGYKGKDASVELDGKPVRVREAISLIFTKTPFYGYGLKIVPKAKLDDGLLHVLLVSGHPAEILSGLVSSIPEGNLFGQHTTCKDARVITERERHLQVDGTLERKGTEFSFRVLPAALKMRF